MADAPTPLEPGGTNAVGVTLGLVGDEWNLLILRYAVMGVRRYGEWREALPISHAVLSGRLAYLTEMAVFEKAEYSGGRLEYRLTKRGRDLWTVLLTVWAWESTWVPQHAESLPVMVHLGCGSEFAPVLACHGCLDAVLPRDVAGTFGPSGGWERSVPSGTTRRRVASSAAGLFPQTMTLIGNRWSAAILGGAFQGLNRFRDFEQRLGAPPAVVADRLRVFRELGIFEQVPSPDRADWTTYHLTDKGRAFFPVVVTSIAWGQRWFQAPEGPALIYRHQGCGQWFAPRLLCGKCGAALRGQDVAVERPELA
ncbi:winged helix-turn-helix transcriptional regulator [Herbidospora mongoliensis]|uniref:winged helix-turn-helix transcriptional regulator n=1 Tax=Herbidospora mongoliensis TaxID=688067 RepID=UPI00082F8BC0|nr:helix-turn-helix domain-containing protein [Herbidospora mongoliensis]